jgi:predicted DNA-binding transcriptional regulator YafY
MDNRERLLAVMRILEKCGIEQKRITAEQIVDQLERESGQSVNRKAIYRDIDAISASTGLEIEGKPGGHGYLVKRSDALTRGEVEVITKAMHRARFITRAETDAVIKKLHRLAGLAREQTKPDTTILLDPAKLPKEDVIKNIELIKKAIKDNKKLQFDYVKYNTSKKLAVEKENCLVSPYECVWYQDYYYLLGSYDGQRLSHYRVDRMARIRSTPDSRKSLTEITGSRRGFDVYGYLGKMVGMASGREAGVEIRFDNTCVGEVIDALGENVAISRDGPEHFILKTRVLLNKKFTKWILGFGAGAVVIRPEELRQEIVQTLARQAESYRI